MKKYLYFSLSIIFVGTSLFLYIYREQNLVDVMDIDRVEKIYIILQNNGPEEFELIKPDDEIMNKLSAFLKQYRVKLTNKNGWTSDHENEQFTLYLGYEGGNMEIFTVERDVVVSTRIYDVVNPPLDYQFIQELEREIKSDENK
ncbi:hypothetical protein AM500_13140 [Bacillus sp. FJAT-18017]|uniref:hypothetical protein n=1 Tax=Bacillus sp. FJAT-18017 TaxID=1705566 RepID=UPI0006AE64F9|nr:hypothetical protein [Bacillus sp. FJAT-18017]ALC90625.1 hypothetical protein AM500_13140 [Bacillus sp. FJAT-18017]